VVAGFQVHVNRRSGCEFPRFSECKNFGVRLSRTRVKSFADNFAVADNYTTDEGIGSGFAKGAAG
jgi:hypothetical protein